MVTHPLPWSSKGIPIPPPGPPWRPLPLVAYVTPSAIQRLSRHGALKPRWRLEVGSGLVGPLNSGWKALGLYHLESCIYIYRNIVCHMYLWYLLVNAMYIQILRRIFVYRSWIELRFASTLLSSQSHQPILRQTLPPIPI